MTKKESNIREKFENLRKAGIFSQATKDKKRPLRVGILGGGLTGLTIAFCLEQKARKKFEVEVLEKEAECGGLLKSFKKEGFTFDYGGAHIIYSRDKKSVDFMLSILGQNYFRKRRNNKIYFKNDFVKYPFENGLLGLLKGDDFEGRICFKKAEPASF